MFVVNDDKSIYITRGDVAYFTATAENDGEKHIFRPGDVVRFKVTAKKDCTKVAFQKDFPILEDTEKVDILLTKEETKIGDVISKPVDYWYEIELNPYTNPQTIVGYDDDGAKIFKLFPEGRDLGAKVAEEDIPVVDAELDLTSDRPVQNQAVTRAMVKLGEKVDKAVAENLSDTERFNAELIDIRKGVDGTVYSSAGEAVRDQIDKLNKNTEMPPYKIDPILRNNSLEAIKWVCQHSDPSRYWKVGDYLLVKRSLYDYGIGCTNYTSWDGQECQAIVTDEELFYSLVGHKAGIYRVIWYSDGTYQIAGVTEPMWDVGVSFDNCVESEQYTDVTVTKTPRNLRISTPQLVDEWHSANSWVDGISSEVFLEATDGVVGTYRFRTYNTACEGSIMFPDGKWSERINLEIYGIFAACMPFFDDYNNLYEDAYAEYEFTVGMDYEEIPFQVIGFNHDKVTNLTSYGKQKAGMTLQMGVNRNHYGDNKVGLPIIPVGGLMTTNGYFKAPNGVSVDLTNAATNWAESGFRKMLQGIFHDTEITPYMVSVQKQTSKFYRSSIYWSDDLITDDKVFLPSEYEMFGEKILAPYKEGEQYELYAEGYSKFMWSQGLLNSPTGTVNRLWLRSGYGAKVNELRDDSSYSCNIYLSVNSFNPLSVIHSPSYSTGGDGVIAPCICI